MPAASSAQTLLDELDARQDDLLRELDRLNERIERVITECWAWRTPADSPTAPPMPAKAA
jgi:hypothetical protein